MIVRLKTLLLIGLLLVASAKADPSATRFVSIEIYPSQVNLNHAEDAQRVIAVATRADDMTLDVTDLATWRVDVENGSKGGIHHDAGVVTASIDGVAKLSAEFAGLCVSAEIKASGLTPAPPVSFRHDVIPVLTYSGCNAGGCHGASRGKDGFQLSLFAFDPVGDHFRLTSELVGRRLNVVLPSESLMLKKAVAEVPHTGGKLMEVDSVYYQTLYDWIEAGSPNDIAEAPTVEQLAIYPPRCVLGEGHDQRFIAVASYSDGTVHDVTHLTLFDSNNGVTAEVDSQGWVTAGKRGEAFVTARFDTYTVGSHVLVLPSDALFEPHDEEPVNYIDELVSAKLRTLRINPSPLAGDDEFLRRVSIDIAGRLPTVEEHHEFLINERPDKRAAKIDQLLQEPEFSQLWAHKWCDLLMVRSQANRVEYKPMYLYSQWVTEQILSDRPINELVTDLLTATGTSFDTPQVNFYQSEPDPKKVAENVAQAFLGIRTQCAQCHNHPFDRWTMDDYYSFAAFFSQIARKQGEDYREILVFNRGSGETPHPVTGKPLPAKFLSGDSPSTKGRDRREVLAEWISSPDNPYFAKNMANRVWAHFFSRGVVEPVDDIRVSNPPSNPELFDKLGEKFAESGFDLRTLVRDICNSNTYQRSCQPTESNRNDTRNFARSVPRRIPAEPLLDCLSQATNSPEKLPGLPLGAKAIEITDGSARNYFLDTFGKSDRQSVCACSAVTEPTLSQALHLLNGAATQEKIRRGKLVQEWIKQEKSNEQIVDQIYLRCLSRKPSDKDRAELLALLPEQKDRQKALEDIFWAVLNSREFLFNH